MTPTKTLVLALALAWGGAAAGQSQPPADLPPTDKVVHVLSGLPTVRAAEASLRGAQAEQHQLRLGEYEYTLGLNAQRRNISDAPDSNEWAFSLQRGLRLPGKARLDDQIGMQLVEEAEEKVGDARHESARQLLGLWYAALRAQSEAVLWKQQVDTLSQEGLIVQKRVRGGDAAKIDQLRADAALAQARSQARLAEARSQAAQSELRLRFPSLPVPAPTAAEPHLPDGSEEDWIGHTLEHNHELLAVRKATERARLTSKRAEQDRTPDPVLGLHYGTENRGDDRILGVSLSIPLAGQGRAAKAAMQLAQAESLHEMEAATRLRLSAEAAANWQAAVSNVDSYARLKEAAEAMDRHASLAKRAHELGELGLSETLLGHRNALEARIAVEQARLGANEAVARLLLDAHQLWPFGGEDHHP